MKLDVIHTGFLKLDGGAMFGVVPRRMWANMLPPDNNNLCTWAMRALLIRTGKRTILVDTGIGNKQDDKFRTHFEPSETGRLFISLEKAGVRPEDVTDVLLTHLHFDHVGGALWKNETDGRIQASFPNAVYWSNQQHWNWAMQPNEREKASFLKENFVPLMEEGRVRMLPVEQQYRFDEDIHLRFVFGHTEAMMLPEVRTPQGTLLYCADLLPSRFHIGMPYVMAYDIRPLVTLQEKQTILSEVAAKGHVLMFEHDPVEDCATLRLDEKGRIVLNRSGSLESFFEM
jgi:glyoxylase-like metal-dependent hydrolase (beta-lactamase superfamily II)